MSAWDARLLTVPEAGLVLDLTDAPAGALPPGTDPLGAMAALEQGAVANPDEQRQVGHYWLRAPERAPSAAQREAIRAAQTAAAAVSVQGVEQVLWIGIGGSALGPQLVQRWLAAPGQPEVYFLDNTDPDGISTILRQVDPRRCVAVVVSKSGGTPETRNGMLAAMAHWEAAGLPFAPSAVAITGEGSRLDALARRPEAPWRAVLPVWDWVGGRTSITGPVGLVLLRLLGADSAAFLEGAAAVDRATRQTEHNPALALALAWGAAGGFRGDRALVVLPYRDRMDLLGRYLQQLIMESLGKGLDRDGTEVLQGLTVYGNKGSTDQHAFVQQVRDGRDDCFVHFVDTAAQGPRVAVDEGRFADDHLVGFLLGTQAALRDAGRPSVRLQLPDCSARSLGATVALFERAVGLYAELININAYHQPGVEAGKRAARSALAELDRLGAALDSEPRTAEALGAMVGVEPRQAWRLLLHLAATGRATRTAASQPRDDTFTA
jgi:glucose-6-phosphate isomerase